MNEQQVAEELARLVNNVAVVTSTVAHLQGAPMHEALASADAAGTLRGVEKSLRVAQLQIAALLAAIE